MIGWQKFYNKNFAKGIALSIVIHLFLVCLLLIPLGDNEPPDLFFFEEHPAQITLHQFDQLNILRNEIIGGGSSGSGKDSNAKLSSGEDAKFGVPSQSNTPDNFELSDKINSPNKDSLNPSSGFGNQGEGGDDSGTGGGIGDGTGNKKGEGKVYTSLPFVPRQILEVLPEKSECGKGVIVLALHVGKNGKVKEHKVMLNSSGTQICLEKVIEAAYKSRWQSVKMEGSVVEYWVEKTYTFY
jgi:hypothetical protein